MNLIDVKGVWPVMLTPFTSAGAVDYKALEQLIAWYEQSGVDGLFADCLSSELFHLSLRERVQLASFIKKTAKVPVIASGHTAYAAEEQQDELRRIADTGVDAVIMISNRFAPKGGSSDLWKKNLEGMLHSLPDQLPLGLYECPVPFKWVLSQDELQFCVDTGRFTFFKDTCCDLSRIQQRLKVMEGSTLRLFNANSSSLLDSLKSGAAGFSGVMANFHADLYVWLCKNWKSEPKKAEQLQAFLTLFSFMERQLYPVNAKYYLQGEGLEMTSVARSSNYLEFCALFQSETDQLKLATQFVRQNLLA
ncbi:MAG: dihydrodipicolinate synthase family protein [Angelakisella sp.]